MKTKFILPAFVLLVTSVLSAATTNDAATLLQRGLFEEEANHHLDAAISDYKEAIEQFDRERQLAATAIFRLGECYRKQGRTNEANAQYARIVREFPDQPQLAQLSQANLPSGGSPSPASAAVTSTLPPDEEKFLRQVKETVQNSPDLVNQQLEFAAQFGYVSAAEFLIAHGADVNLGTPMIAAARSGNEAMVELLLSHGAAVDTRDGEGGTPLSYAVRNGFMAVCHTLVAHGADVNVKDDHQVTPLQIAVEQRSLEAAEFLIANKAQISPDLMNVNLLRAAQLGRLPVAEFLIAHGVDVNLRAPIVAAAVQGSEAMVRLLLNHGAKVDSRGDGGRTALGYAVEKGYMDVCRVLVAHGADVNAKDDHTMTPLQIAVEHGNLEAAAFLLTNKAQLDIQSQGSTPLTSAIMRRQIAIVKLLLDNHADANMESEKPKEMRIPLDCAIYVDSPDIVNLLLENHADPNAVPTSNPASSDYEGPPAGEFRLRPIPGRPSQKRSPWDAPMPVTGETPLMFANYKTHATEIVPMLLHHGANPNAQDRAQRFPLTGD